MNRFLTLSIKFFFTALPLYIIGMFVFPLLYEIFVPKVKGVSFVIGDSEASIKTWFLFSSILAWYPIPVYLVWRQAKIVTAGRKFASVLIIIAFVVVASFIWSLAIKSYYTGIAKNSLPAGSAAPVTYEMDLFNYLYYVVAGLFTGGIATYFLLKEKS